MATSGSKKFFVSIVLPSILAICLFVLSIYAIIIPAFEQNMMERKKEMISELTNTALSLIKEYDNDYKNGIYTLEDAKLRAAARIEKLRYGIDRKDYFWITDFRPFMVMHPYRRELIGSDLSDYQDPKGTRLFKEAVKLVNEQGEGYINYMWQWKDDTTRIVPKLSYVKSYPKWDWILGTGVYLEDVKEETSTLKYRLLRISSLIVFIISISLLYIVKQSLNIEKKRKSAEEKLKLSRQKYKSLVEASPDGTLMIMNEKIIFSNYKFNQMLGCTTAEVLALHADELFSLSWQEIKSRMNDPERSATMEAQLRTCSDEMKDVILSVSRIKYADQDGFIVITSDVTKQKQMEIEGEHLSDELQTSLLLMNQPIRHLIKDLVVCKLETPIIEAAGMMTRKSREVIFVGGKSGIIGVINDSDLKKRVTAKGLDTSGPVSGIMTSPVIGIPERALLYEAILLFDKEGVTHLAAKNSSGEIIGVISRRDALEMQRNTMTYFIREIEMAEDVDQLKKIHERVPVLVNALVASGDKTQNITRIITSLSDAISKRLIKLALEQMEPPPCRFAFIAMGSEGRMEQTLSTDQDNAIIFEDLEGDLAEKARVYFLKLGAMVNANLDKVGYRLCKGGLMAGNEKWAQPLRVWKTYFSEWITNGDPQSVLDATIIFDFRCIHGETAYSELLRTHINEVTDEKAVFFQHMAMPIIKFKAPLSLFGKIVSEESKKEKIIDIKKMLLPITGFIRLYAIKYQLDETNSLARSEKLFKMKKINKSLYHELILSYNYLMMLRFRFQTSKMLKNELPDNLVDVNQLTHIEKTTLKKIFSEIGNLQTQVNFDFKGSM